MKNWMKKFTLMAAGVTLAMPAMVQAATSSEYSREQLSEKVRHELVMLPYYNVFDHLKFQVDSDGNVTLLGQVSRPTLKSDAYNVVKRLEGVQSVTNKIEVLPLSPFDDRVRLGVARAIFGNSVLSRYAWGARPAISIIVKNGNVTLEGVVANEMDRNIANIKANGVFGVFSVTNNLRIEGKYS
jgi:hyperosmotically inducible protein